MGSLASPSAVTDILQRFNFKPSKGLGQNFLIDANIVRKIVEAGQVTVEDVVVEIGPGVGALTEQLAATAQKVVAVELDKRLLPILTETLSRYTNVDVVNADALQVDFDFLVGKHAAGYAKKYIVMANLPYYITTPIIMHLLEKRFSVSRLVVMVQKEVAMRMLAGPGTKDYSAFTVAVRYYSSPSLAFKVSPKVFLPQPEVESAVVKMDILDKPPVDPGDEQLFFKVVKAAFGQRRKSLPNALQSNLEVDKRLLLHVLAQAGIDSRSRAEELDLYQFAALTRCLQALCPSQD